MNNSNRVNDVIVSLIEEDLENQSVSRLVESKITKYHTFDDIIDIASVYLNESEIDSLLSAIIVEGEYTNEAINTRQRLGLSESYSNMTLHEYFIINENRNTMKQLKYNKRSLSHSTPESRMFSKFAISDSQLLDEFDDAKGNIEDVISYLIDDYDVPSNYVDDFTTYIYDRLIQLDLF